jgi:hypothetical protein
VADKETGRPSKYSEELANEICELIATSSMGLNHICKKLQIAPSSVYKWLIENPNFSEKYTRAREAQADFMAEEIIEIADDSSQDLAGIDDYGNKIENREFVNRSKLRVDARKWAASKLAPKKYGEKLDVVSNGETISSYNVGFKKPEE